MHGACCVAVRVIRCRLFVSAEPRETLADDRIRGTADTGADARFDDHAIAVI